MTERLDHPPPARRPRRARLLHPAGLLHQHLGPEGRAQRLRPDLPGRRGQPRAVRRPAARGGRQADRPDLLRRASAADVDTLAGQLAADGVQLVSEPGDLQTPGGGYGFRFFDNEGRTVEISSDVAVREHRAIEEGESIPVRLSHVVINSADPEATLAFYEKHLSFSLSDTLMHPRMGNMMWFMRTNPWHHIDGDRPRPAPLAAPRELRDARHRRVHARHRPAAARRGREDLGPGPAHGRQQHLQLLPRPHGNTMEYTTELERPRRGHLAPAHVRLHPARGQPTSGAPRTR